MALVPIWREEMNKEQLRDVFAAHALTAILSHPHYLDMAYEDLAEMAYTMADEMLVAREYRKP